MFHMLVLIVATLLFVLAAIVGDAAYEDGEVGAGMRVLSLVDEPAKRAVTPGHEEKGRAEAG